MRTLGTSVHLGHLQHQSSTTHLLPSNAENEIDKTQSSRGSKRNEKQNCKDNEIDKKWSGTKCGDGQIESKVKNEGSEVEVVKVRKSDGMEREREGGREKGREGGSE